MVVNYDIPDDMDSFIHRVGRTGRIGRDGQAWSLVSKNDSSQLSKIIATYGLNIEESVVPKLAKNIDRDLIQYKDDYMESADVFGFVPITITSDGDVNFSSRKISQWLTEKMNCNELAIGQIKFNDSNTIINIHIDR